MRALVIVVILIIIFVLYCYCKKSYKPLVIRNEGLSRSRRVPPPTDLNPQSITQYVLANVAAGNVVFLRVGGKFNGMNYFDIDIGDPRSYLAAGTSAGYAGPAVMVDGKKSINSAVISNNSYRQYAWEDWSPSIQSLATELPQALSMLMYNKGLQVTVIVLAGDTFMGKNTYKGYKVNGFVVLYHSLNYQGVISTDPPVIFKDVKVIDMQTVT